MLHYHRHGLHCSGSSRLDRCSDLHRVRRRRPNRLRHAGVEMENGRDVASWALEAACWISPWSRVQWKVPDQAVCAAGTLGVSPRRTTAAAEAVWSAPSAPKACERRRDGAVLASHVEVHRTRSSPGHGSHGGAQGGSQGNALVKVNNRRRTRCATSLLPGVCLFHRSQPAANAFPLEVRFAFRSLSRWPGAQRPTRRAA